MAPASIPEEIWINHQSEIVAVDYFYIQSISHFHSIGKTYQMRIVETVIHRRIPSKDAISRSLTNTVNMYHGRNITVAQINADNQFRCIKEDLHPIPVNIVAAGEHVGTIERSIRTMKNGTRFHVHRLPYRRYPTVMVRACVIKVTKDLNDVPSGVGVSKDISPASFIAGRPTPDYNKVTELNFGDYVQAFTVRNKTNDNEERGVGAIALYPSGNAQGGWTFMSLLTGKEIHRFQWDVIPITDDVIGRVDKIALAESQPLVATNFNINGRKAPQ